MSGRTLDGIQTYPLRWRVEGFFEDWKLYDGWGPMAKQPGVEGSRSSLTVSLLCDHALRLHPEQQASWMTTYPRRPWGADDSVFRGKRSWKSFAMGSRQRLSPIASPN